MRCDQAVIDGEIVCLGADGRSRFNDLLFRREWPYFMAFDLLWVDGRDLRELPLIDRKRQLKAIMPSVQSRIVYVDHIENRGVDLFRLAYKRDLEGIVAKWRHGIYQIGGSTTSWLKVKNARYSQGEGRRELFAARAEGSRGRYVAPRFRLA